MKFLALLLLVFASCSIALRCDISVVLDEFYVKSFGSVHNTTSALTGDIRRALGEAQRIFNRTFSNVHVEPTRFVFAKHLGGSKEALRDSAIALRRFQTAISSGSLRHLSDSCLVMQFTHQHFNDAAFGQSCRANTRPYSGACGSNGLNGVLINTYHHGRHIEYDWLVESILHELGHAFGAGHDTIYSFAAFTRYQPQCDPTDMPYIMDPIRGREPLGTVFSPCSVQAISNLSDRSRETCQTQKQHSNATANLSLFGNFDLRLLKYDALYTLNYIFITAAMFTLVF